MHVQWSSLPRTDPVRTEEVCRRSHTSCSTRLDDHTRPANTRRAPAGTGTYRHATHGHMQTNTPRHTHHTFSDAPAALLELLEELAQPKAVAAVGIDQQAAARHPREMRVEEELVAGDMKWH
jgi:hypothetical protein